MSDITKTLKRDMLDDDGENRAVRGLLSLIYGSGQYTVTTKQMRDHLSNLGFDGCWPVWAAQDQTLTKGGVQAWIRHLISLEAAASHTSAPEAPDRGPWRYGYDNGKHFIESDDFTHDVRLCINGDFAHAEDCEAYGEAIARQLNASTPAAGHQDERASLADKTKEGV